MSDPTPCTAKAMSAKLYGSREQHYRSQSQLLIHVHIHGFILVHVYFSVLLSKSNTVEEACLCIPGSNDASVAMLHLQLNFP